MKTIERVCLRCDWEGESRDPDCPNCGTRLWVPSTAQEPRARRGPLAWFQRYRRARAAEREVEDAPPTSTPTPAPSARPAEAPPDRPVAPGTGERRRAWIPVAVVAVLAVVVVTVVRAGAPPEPVDPWAATLGGRILYAAPDPEDAAMWRLWVWDVGTGTATLGPRIEEPSMLVTVGLGRWVGSVAETPTGLQAAQMARNLGPDDAAVTVLEGELATWDAEGTRAFAITKSADCAAFEVERFDPSTFVRDEIPLEPLCGEAIGLASVGGSAYVTLAADDGSTIRSAFSRGTQVVGRGGVGLSGSGTDLLTARGTGELPAEASVVSLTPGPTEGPPRPVGDEADPLVVESVLSADRFGIGTLVLGTYEGRRGIYAVPTDELEALEPELVSAIDARVVGATIARDGSVILVLDGAFYLVRGGTGGSRLDLELPEGGPAPAGAVLWVEGEGA